MAYGARDEDQSVLQTWSIRTLRAQFRAYPPELQQAIRQDIAQRLPHLHPQSALRKLALPVYGVREGSA